MKKLIRDDGVIRKCPNNMARMGYWQNYREFHSYRKTIKRFAGFWSELRDAVFMLLSAVVIGVLFPVLPFLQCLCEWRRSIKQVKDGKKFMGDL